VPVLPQLLHCRRASGDRLARNMEDTVDV